MILSDNGSPFKNEELEKYYEKLGITPMYVPPYHQQTNPVERINETVKTIIVSFLEKSHTKWDEHIDELAFTYNTAIQDTTGESPAFINYGRHPEWPGFLRQREGLECLDNRAFLISQINFFFRSPVGSRFQKNNKKYSIW